MTNLRFDLSFGFWTRLNTVIFLVFIFKLWIFVFFIQKLFFQDILDSSFFVEKIVTDSLTWLSYTTWLYYFLDTPNYGFRISSETPHSVALSSNISPAPLNPLNQPSCPWPLVAYQLAVGYHEKKQAFGLLFGYNGSPWFLLKDSWRIDIIEFMPVVLFIFFFSTKNLRWGAGK